MVWFYMFLPYDEDFYKNQQEGSKKSAQEIIPLVLELIHPKSVVDVGCGVGTWLSIFKHNGIKDILGVDGDYVNEIMLQIPKEYFLSFDLKNPLQIDRKFDLVVSLEVAEHLPPANADIFIDSLTRLGNVILFSASIPFQGGQNHINEQWPDYWINKFQDRKYVVIDCIRKSIWYNDNVDFWYAQNIFIFVHFDHLESYPLLKDKYMNTNNPISIVHPKRYLNAINQKDITLKVLLKAKIQKRIKRYKSFFSKKLHH